MQYCINVLLRNNNEIMKYCINNNDIALIMHYRALLQMPLYIYVLHFFAHPTYLVCAPLPLSPDWRH